MKKSIFIYCDNGVNYGTLAQTFDCLNAYFENKCDIKHISADEVISGTWRSDAIMFVMPGGAATPYAYKLNGLGNQMIKEFVALGGTYLGICAGAYYASKEIEFDKDGKLEILCSHELGFFPGKSIGPAISFYDYNSNSGASAARILYDFNDLGIANLYHHDGGFFENAEQYENIEVVASYVIDQNTYLPAIINAHYEQGRAILSGVHFEIDPFSPRANILEDYEAQNLISLLQETNSQREILLNILLGNVYNLIDNSLL